ncbi:MAG: class I adenylate cyclase [Spirochaetes bacterium]|nr:class I adenylate cyclase [Spirochaetota bacterium]
MNTNEFFERIKTNKTNFINYNQIRLKKFKNYIAEKQLENVVDAIPLILCSNHPDLPGYIEGYNPIGIYNFTPSNNALNLIRKLFPNARPETLKNTKPIIELFAMMGSAGSIAYNEESDIDYWVCFDQHLVEGNSLRQLKIKLSGVESWAAEKYNLEIHFFLNDISRIKESIFDSDEDDISGKALGKLLKDEFFRTSIILHGKIPFWWVVPAGTTDEDYEKYLNIIQKSELSSDFIDLGNLHLIKKEEFLGAGIFQILKSLGNPFKSIIKIGILEKYLLEEKNDNPLLCNILKEKIQSGIFDVYYIDPYILMFNQVVEYYSKKTEQDPLVLELLRRCFYIKIDPNLSTIASEDKKEYLPEKKLIMLEYARKWNWLKIKLKQMDEFRDWDISALNKFWNNISKLILKTYKNILSSIESHKITQKFTDEEMRYISRRISSSFASGENRIRPAVSFNDNPMEKFLFIESISQEDGSISWLLSKGFLSGSGSSKRSIIHKEPNLLAILAWISINRLYQNNITRVEIKSRYHLLEQSYVRELLNDLTMHFSQKKVNIKNKYFFSNPFPIINYVIINLFAKYPKGIEDIYYLTYNSWGENVYEKYNSELDFSTILTKMLNGAIEHKEDFKDCVALTSPYPYKASKEFKLILYLFNDIYNFFVSDNGDGTEKKITKKYITTLGGNFVLFSHLRVKKENKITCNVFNTELKMLYSLSGLQGIKNVIKVNQMNPELNHLKIIIDNFRDDAIQIYYQKARKYCYFFVSDERGSLIFFRKNAEIFQDYLTRLYVFSKNIISQIMKNNPGSVFNHKESKGIEIYNLERNDLNQCKISEINPAQDENIFRHEKKIIQFKLSLLLLENGEIGYRFNLPDGGISDNLSKTDIPNIAREIKVLMETAKDYNYFVTDINYANLDFKMYKDYSTFSFIEKNKFELLIEKGLNLSL